MLKYKSVLQLIIELNFTISSVKFIFGIGLTFSIFFHFCPSLHEKDCLCYPYILSGTFLISHDNGSIPLSTLSFKVCCCCSKIYLEYVIPAAGVSQKFWPTGPPWVCFSIEPNPSRNNRSAPKRILGVYTLDLCIKCSAMCSAINTVQVTNSYTHILKSAFQFGFSPSLFTL